MLVPILPEGSKDKGNNMKVFALHEIEIIVLILDC